MQELNLAITCLSWRERYLPSIANGHKVSWDVTAVRVSNHHLHITFARPLVHIDCHCTCGRGAHYSFSIYNHTGFFRVGNIDIERATFNGHTIVFDVYFVFAHFVWSEHDCPIFVSGATNVDSVILTILVLRMRRDATWSGARGVDIET